LYSSPDIIRQIKSRRMRWVGHMACVGEERKRYRILVEKPEGKEDRGVYGRMGSEWILGRLAGGVKSGSSWLRIGIGGGSCKYGDEPAGSGATELVSVPQ
jgi:hypothetical protein